MTKIKKSKTQNFFIKVGKLLRDIVFLKLNIYIKIYLSKANQLSLQLLFN